MQELVGGIGMQRLLPDPTVSFGKRQGWPIFNACLTDTAFPKQARPMSGGHHPRVTHQKAAAARAKSAS